MATTDNNDFRLDTFQVGILYSLIVPRLVSRHMTVPVGYLGMPVQALDGGMQSPDLEAILRFDDVQDSTGPDKVGIE